MRGDMAFTSALTTAPAHNLVAQQLQACQQATVLWMRKELDLVAALQRDVKCRQCQSCLVHAVSRSEWCALAEEP